MYYHLVIKTKNGEYLKLIDEKNLKKISEYAELFRNKEEFFLEKKVLSFDEIDEFIILQSEKNYNAIVKTEEDKYETILLGVRDEELFKESSLVKNITSNLLQQIKKEKNNMQKNSVFIIHGRDNEMKLEVATYLHELGLKPIILEREAARGKTIIEQIEEYSNVKFAIALYSPDDEGRLKQKGEKLKDRARQNVIFEHGYLIGKLGRDKVMAIVKSKDMEIPSDLSGVIYTTFKDWKEKLIKELEATKLLEIKIKDN